MLDEADFLVLVDKFSSFLKQPLPCPSEDYNQIYKLELAFWLNKAIQHVHCMKGFVLDAFEER